MRRKKELPIFKRGDYWYCYVRLPSGKREQRALHLRDDGSPASYKAAVGAYWQEQARATSGADARAGGAKKPLGKAILALTAAQELAGLTDHSHDNVLYRGKCLTDYFGKDYDLSQLVDNGNAIMVEYATKAVAGDPEKDLKPRAPSTVRMELDVLLRCARAVGLNPPARPKMKGVKAKRQRPLTREQLRMFFLALHPRQRLLGLTLITLGCRASEPAKIDDEIDWENRTLWLLGTKTEGSRRQLPIPDELYAFMLDLKNRGLWTGFPKQSRQAVTQVVRAACERAFGAPRSVNDLRGTWATLTALDGVAADIRAAFQGNSVEMQSRTYAQPALMPDDLRKAVAHGIPRVRNTPLCIVDASNGAASTNNTATMPEAAGAE